MVVLHNGEHTMVTFILNPCSSFAVPRNSDIPQLLLFRKDSFALSEVPLGSKGSLFFLKHVVTRS